MFAFASCGRDTCNQKIGDTFNSIEKPEILSTNDSNLVLFDLSISTNSSLPTEYFEAGTLFNIQDTASKVDSISISNSFIKFFIVQVDLPTIENTKSVSYTLFFPDRRDYIDCVHPGSSDAYELNINYSIHNSSGIYDISDFEWEENHRAGAF